LLPEAIEEVVVPTLARVQVNGVLSLQLGFVDDRPV